MALAVALAGTLIAIAASLLALRAMIGGCALLLSLVNTLLSAMKV